MEKLRMGCTWLILPPSPSSSSFLTLLLLSSKSISSITPLLGSFNPSANWPYPSPPRLDNRRSSTVSNPNRSCPSHWSPTRRTAVAPQLLSPPALRLQLGDFLTNSGQLIGDCPGLASYPHFVLLRTFGSGQIHQETTPKAAMDLRQSIRNQTDVSLAITRHVSSIEAKGSNMVFSPLSLHVVVSLIAAGAKGPTLDQLLTFLKSKSIEEINTLSSELVSIVFADGSAAGGPKLTFANGVWVDQTLSLKPSFKEVVVNQYKAASQQVDFQSKAAEVVSEVNSWAEKETSGLIKDVIPADAVNSSTRLIFANALYFKGAWSEKFDASKTKEDDFHLLDGNSVKVPFMTSRKKQVIGTFDGFKVLGLPYKVGEDKRQFSMYILLPDAKDGLPALVEKVGSQSGFLDRHLPTEKVEVDDFKLPRFKVAFGFEASETLKELGVSSPFTEGGLTEMVDSAVGQNLVVSKIFQKSFIEVNEEGTEAASVSAAVIFLRCAPGAKVDFVADHPFLFLIREDMTGVVLFVGHVLNPLAA